MADTPKKPFEVRFNRQVRLENQSDEKIEKLIENTDTLKNNKPPYINDADDSLDGAMAEDNVSRKPKFNILKTKNIQLDDTDIEEERDSTAQEYIEPKFSIIKTKNIQLDDIVIDEERDEDVPINQEVENVSVKKSNNRLIAAQEPTLKKVTREKSKKSFNVDAYLQSPYLPEIKDECNIQELFKNAIDAGNNRLSQTILNEILEIDDTWILAIENALNSIETIVKSPYTFIKQYRQVVSVERIRKVDALSVRHLAMHSENVRQVNDDGTVIPNKVQTGFMEHNLAIYENRFLYTLILRLKRFLDDKHKALKDNMNTQDTTRLGMHSEFSIGHSKVDCQFKIVVHSPSELDKAMENNKVLLTKLELCQKRIKIIEKTEFMAVLRKSKIILPPIQKTNLLGKNHDYRKCYDLWLFLSAFHSVGFEITSSEKTLPFDQDYYDDMTKIVSESLEVMLKNNRLRRAVFDGVKYRPKKRREFKVVREVEFKTPTVNKTLLNKDSTLSQYYFERTKSLISQVSEKSKAGDIVENIEVNTGFRRFFKGLQIVNNELYKDMLNLERTESIETENPILKKKEEIRLQKLALKKHKLLTKLKQDEVNLAKRREATQETRLVKLQRELEVKQKVIALKKQKEKEKKEKELQAKSATADKNSMHKSVSNKPAHKNIKESAKTTINTKTTKKDKAKTPVTKVAKTKKDKNKTSN